MNLKHDKSIFGTIAVMLVLISSQFLFSCKNNSSPKKSIGKDSIVTKVDTAYIHDTLYIEQPIPFAVLKDTIIYRDVPVNVDTSAILAIFNFNEKKINVDTLKLEYGYIAVIDTVSGGSIISRKYFSKIKVPVKEKIQKIKEEPRGNLYLGLNGGLDKPNYVYSLGTSLLYQTPGKQIYEIGIGVRNKTMDGINGEFVPFIHGGVFWKLPISLKKK
jgi:hypothetical protein